MFIETKMEVNVMKSPENDEKFCRKRVRCPECNAEVVDPQDTYAVLSKSGLHPQRTKNIRGHLLDLRKERKRRLISNVDSKKSSEITQNIYAQLTENTRPSLQSPHFLKDQPTIYREILDAKTLYDDYTTIKMPFKKKKNGLFKVCVADGSDTEGEDM